MVVVTSKPWACIEVNMKETGGGNAATVYLHGDEIQVRDVLEALERPADGKRRPPSSRP